MQKIRAFILGFVEFKSSFTTRHEDLDLSDSYDHGREFAHRLTLRRYE